MRFAGAGIQLPKTFDLKGILSLVLQILGLTWQNIRRIAVEMVGEQIVKTLEALPSRSSCSRPRGRPALWRWIKEKLVQPPADARRRDPELADHQRDQGRHQVDHRPDEPGLGVPEGVHGHLRDREVLRCERARQIADLISAITDSIGAIARGSVGAAAKKVEAALAKSIPVAIGFLASLLGLGDITATIKRFIDRIREPVEAAIRWLSARQSLW